MPEEEVVELKFRLYDGTDIGPFRYSPTSTVAVLKERIFAEWPKEVLLYWESSLQCRHEWHLFKLSVEEPSDYVGYHSNDKKLAPKASSELKLISAGKMLENSKTVGQCRVPFGDLGVITMHVVVQSSLAKAKSEKKLDKASRRSFCSCTIM